jgi:hypothetical protein
VPFQQTIALSVDDPDPAAKSSRSVFPCIKCPSAVLIQRVFAVPGLLKNYPEKFKVANTIKVKLNSKCNENSLFKSFWDFQIVIS